MGRLLVRLTVGLLIGLALAVARHWGPMGVVAVVFTVLLATNVLAWFQGARWQVFGAGFAAVGWAYLWLALVTGLGAYLPTTALLESAYDRLDPSPPTAADLDEFDDPVLGPERLGERARFLKAGHAVVALGAALVGGAVAAVLFAGKRRESPCTAPMNDATRPVIPR